MLYIVEPEIKTFQNCNKSKKSDKIDPIGSCVGPKGTRVKAIVDELGEEKIDIIKYSENPKDFISEALSPSQVISVSVNEEEKTAQVVVPDYQLSLAIGQRGQNARLAAKLTNWKIDIKSETQYTQYLKELSLNADNMALELNEEANLNSLEVDEDLN